MKTKNWYKGLTATAITVAMAGAAFTVPALAYEYDLSVGDVYVNGYFSWQEGNTEWSQGNPYNHVENEDYDVIISQNGETPTNNAVNIAGDTTKQDNDMNIVIKDVNATVDATEDGSNAFLTVEGGSKTEITLEDVNVSVDANNEVGSNGAGIYIKDGETSATDVTLNVKGENNTINGQNVDNITGTENTNIVGIQVGGNIADSNASTSNTGTSLTIQGSSEQTVDQNGQPEENTLNIGKVGEGISVTTGNDLTINGGTENDVTVDIDNVLMLPSTSSGQGINLNGDLVVTGDANLNISKVEGDNVAVDADKGNIDYSNGFGIINKNGNITISDGANVTITDADKAGIYSSDSENPSNNIRVDNATLTITKSESGSPDSGIVMESNTDLTVQNGGKVNISGMSGYGIVSETSGSVTVTGKESSLVIDGAKKGIYSGKEAQINVMDSGKLTIDSTQTGMDFVADSEGLTVDNATLEMHNNVAGMYLNGGDTNIRIQNNANVTIDALEKQNTTDDDTQKATMQGYYGINSGGSPATGGLYVDNATFSISNTEYGIIAYLKDIKVEGKGQLHINNVEYGMNVVYGEDGGTSLDITDGSTVKINVAESGERGIKLYGGNKVTVNDANLYISGAGYGIVVSGNNNVIDIENSDVKLTNKDAGIFVNKNSINNELNEDTASKENVSTPYGSHIEATNGIYGADGSADMTVQVMGGTLTYNFSKPYTFWPVNNLGDPLTNFIVNENAAHADFMAYYLLPRDGMDDYQYLCDMDKENGTMSIWVPAADIRYVVDTDAIDDDLLNKILEQLIENGYDFDYNYPDGGDLVLTDKVINGHSISFTLNNDKLVWADSDYRYEGAAIPHDLVYGTTLTVDGTEYNINWYIPDNAGVLQAFTTATNVIGGTDGMVTVYGALVTPPEEPEPPVIDPEYPEYPELPDYDPPEVDIDDPDVPLVEEPEEPEQPTEEIDDEETPLTPSIPDEEIDEIIAEIEDEVTPLTSVPQTGADEMPAATAALPAGVLAAAVAAMVRKIRRKG